MLAEKNVCVWATYDMVICYTEIHIGDVLPGGCGGAVAGGNSVGTLREKQTDREVVRRVHNRLAQIH